MPRRLQQSVHNCLTDARCGKTLRVDRIHIPVIKLAQDLVQVAGNGILIFPGADADNVIRLIA